MFRKKMVYVYLDSDICILATAETSQQFSVPKSVSEYGSILDWTGYSAILFSALAAVPNTGVQVRFVLAPHLTYVFQKTKEFNTDAVAAIIPVPQNHLFSETLTHAKKSYVVFVDDRLLSTISESLKKASLKSGGIFTLSLYSPEPPQTISYHTLHKVCATGTPFRKNTANPQDKKGMLSLFS